MALSDMDKPLCIELFAGLHGWAEGFIEEGFRVVGFDIVDMCAVLGKPRPKGVQIVLQDVLTLHGSQFRNAAVIVASPPCQAYSYRAMPWKRAKALPPPDNALFEACFRIQREACEAAGHHIPLVVENVKGAQPWVGRAAWHYGSFYLWGDVPALMPVVSSLRSVSKNGSTDIGGTWFKVAHGVQVPIQAGNPMRGINEPGTKQRGSGPVWFDSGIAALPSSSSRRKAASAQIAKIPLPLAQHIARVYR